VAGTRNPEDVIAAMKTIIEASLPANLDLLDTEYSATGVEVLDDLVKVWLAPQERHQQQNLPCLTLMAVETEWDQERGQQEAVYQHRIAGELILRGNARTVSLAPEELLTAKLQRTVRGIVETLEATRQLTVSGAKKCDYIAFESAAYSETIDADDNRLEKRAEVSFLCLVSV
jgi:hypothetical protein